MIINLEGKVIKNDIIFDECPVYFNHNQFVHVNELFIQFEKPCKELYGYIESSLIDRSTVNLKQQLLFFQQKEESSYIYYSPTQIAKYKIQCQSILSSVFKLHLCRQEKIEKIYLQLEITNARV